MSGRNFIFSVNRIRGYTTRTVAVLLLSGVACAQDPLTLDPAHYAVAFENEHVRALRVRYGPGEGSPMHEHPHGVGVAMTNTKGRFELPDGSVREASGTAAGSVFWRAATRHANQNMLGTPAEMIEVDLKRAPARPAATVAKGDSPDATEVIELENEFVRVLRSRIMPGARTAQHAHSPRVTIAIGDQQLRVGDRAGALHDRRLRKGEVVWEEAGSVVVENAGAAMAESIIIELKLSAR